jgi:hypothetical protein
MRIEKRGDTEYLIGDGTGCGIGSVHGLCTAHIDGHHLATGLDIGFGRPVYHRWPIEPAASITISRSAEEIAREMVNVGDFPGTRGYVVSIDDETSGVDLDTSEVLDKEDLDYLAEHAREFVARLIKRIRAERQSAQPRDLADGDSLQDAQAELDLCWQALGEERQKACGGVLHRAVRALASETDAAAAEPRDLAGLAEAHAEIARLNAAADRAWDALGTIRTGEDLADAVTRALEEARDSAASAAQPRDIAEGAAATDARIASLRSTLDGYRTQLEQRQQQIVSLQSRLAKARRESGTDAQPHDLAGRIRAALQWIMPKPHHAAGAPGGRSYWESVVVRPDGSGLRIGRDWTREDSEKRRAEAIEFVASKLEAVVCGAPTKRSAR